MQMCNHRQSRFTHLCPPLHVPCSRSRTHEDCGCPSSACAMLAAQAVCRILFLSLEFSTGAFSGNGVYAQAQVRSLRALGHKVLVIAGKPQAHNTMHQHNDADLYEVPLPVWGRLDAGAAWREFAAGISTTDSMLPAAITTFAPHVLLFVDWSALAAARAVKAVLPLLPKVYLNYRVFSRTAVGADLDLVCGLEAAAMREAALSIALSRSDAAYLQEIVAGADPSVPLPKVLLPALREDMRQLSISVPADPGADCPSDLCNAAVQEALCSGIIDHQVITKCKSSKVSNSLGWADGRRFITCCVRLSTEKEPHRFVDLAAALTADGTLQHLGLTPLLIAGTATDAFAKSVKAHLRATCPDAVIVESFLDAPALAHLYRQTRLNVHPATYDAYGMTIVEAASQGAPSLVHDGDGAVGATDLLCAAKDEILLLDLLSESLAADARHILLDANRLAAIGAAARSRSCEWDEHANAGQLAAWLVTVVHPVDKVESRP